MSWSDDSYSDMIQSHTTPVGLFFLMHSALPVVGDSAGKLLNCARFARGRDILAIDHDPIALDPEYYNTSWWETTAWGGGSSYQVWGIVAPAGYCHGAWGSIALTSGIAPGGVRRLAKQASTTCVGDRHAISGEDLYVPAWPNQRIIACDHAFDTFIRPGTNDLSGKYLNVPHVFEGPLDRAFDEFFAKAGQELQFVPAEDGYVYMNAASEIARGAALEPVWKFTDGLKCQIKKKIPVAPFPDAVVGQSTSNSQISTDWKQSRFFKIKTIKDNSRAGSDLADYLDLFRNDDTTSWEILSENTDLLLKPGDYIWANGEAARCRDITETPNQLKINAGRSLYTLNDQWGLWKNAASSLGNAHIIQSQEWDFDGAAGTQTFVVKAREYVTGDWCARLKTSWQLGGSATEKDVVAYNPFAICQLNSKVIPPGRIRLKKDSGSLEIDISDLCSVSTTADTTNTFAAQVYGGLTKAASPTCYHKISGSIDQYKRVLVIENA